MSAVVSGWRSPRLQGLHRTLRPGMVAASFTRRVAVGSALSCSAQVCFTPFISRAAAPQSPLCDQDVAVLTTGNKQIVIVGTAHVSEESASLVRQVIQEVQPDTVMVELDKRRAASLMYKAKLRRSGELSAVATVKPDVESRGAALYRSLEERGFPAGGEFVAAIEEARLLNATVLCGDQEIDVTLSRLKEARAEVRRLRADGLLSRDDAKAAVRELPSSLTRRTAEMSVEELGRMTTDIKQRDNARAVATYLKQAAPPVYEAMIGERDKYMAYALEVAPGESLVAVVGLAHVDGLERILGQQILARPRSCNLPPLEGAGKRHRRTDGPLMRLVEDDAPQSAATEMSMYQTSASGLRYLDVGRGPEGAPVASSCDAVRIRYSGRLLSNAARSVGGGRLAVWELEARHTTLSLGSNRANGGMWDDCLLGMRVGGARRILLPPSATRRPSKKGRDIIPPGETAVIECDLVRIERGAVALGVRYGLLGEGSVFMPLAAIAVLNAWLGLIVFPWLLGGPPASAATTAFAEPPPQNWKAPTARQAPVLYAAAATPSREATTEYQSAEQAQAGEFAAAETARAASTQRIRTAKAGFESRVEVLERAFSADSFVDACDDLAFYVIGQGRIPEGARLSTAVSRIRSTYNALPTFPVPCESVGNLRDGTRRCFTHSSAVEKAYSALLRELKKYARKGLDVKMSGGTELPNFVGGQSF